MITLEKEFETNANATGTQTFRQIKAGTRVHVNKRTKEQSNQNVYIYQRIDKEGKTFGFEVVIPNVVKGGTVQKFPNGTTKEIEDDTEMYPGASSFGRTGWFLTSEARAEDMFDEIMKGSDSEESNGDVIKIPDHEFAVKDYAEELGVPYTDVANWAQVQIKAGKLKVVRQERRAKRGRATNILARV